MVTVMSTDRCSNDEVGQNLDVMCGSNQSKVQGPEYKLYIGAVDRTVGNLP